VVPTSPKARPRRAETALIVRAVAEVRVAEEIATAQAELSLDQARPLARMKRSLPSHRLAIVDLLQNRMKPTRLRRTRVKPLANHEAEIADVEVVVVVAVAVVVSSKARTLRRLRMPSKASKPRMVSRTTRRASNARASHRSRLRRSSAAMGQISTRKRLKSARVVSATVVQSVAT